MFPPSEAQTKPLQPLQGMTGTSEELIKRLNDSLKQYNDICLFAPVDSPIVLAQRTILADKLDSVRSTLADVAIAVEDTTRNVQEATAVEATRVSSLNKSTHWYEHGNLLDLPEEQMMELLDAHPPRDAVHFGKHVHHWLSEGLQSFIRTSEASYRAARELNENVYWDWECEDDPTFAPKRVRLILALLSLPGGFIPGYQELVWAKCNLLQKHRHLPTTFEQIETLGNGIGTTIEMLFHYPPGSNHNRTLSLLGICGVKRLRLHCTSSDYYDTVRARRTFYKAWKEMICEDDCTYDSIKNHHGSTGGPCWHGFNTFLMTELTWRAHAELKHNVKVAAQHILPQELLDEIFEYSLLLEDLPFNPDIRDEETGEYNWEYWMRDCGYQEYLR
ncbi:hypothetical protein LTR56_010318 [Elasticomyces elasticus]|nr:hypothetical protein LTR56_010318 [Elasticomyces elasticus]KAK3656886.1 hypothetical protein LTR22_009548 [Elasticomyces elasticus]KAK4926112.1 hypothetical protein LTR49_007027 [Elasticomyces elasticus]KAK5766117.1 hypothetical protein LTS12_003600 [Elasticomyces elasticus]